VSDTPSPIADSGRVICHGLSALGWCQKDAKYDVGERAACGIHLAQVLKAQLQDGTRVVVGLLPPITRSGTES